MDQLEGQVAQADHTVIAMEVLQLVNLEVMDQLDLR